MFPRNDEKLKLEQLISCNTTLKQMLVLQQSAASPDPINQGGSDSMLAAFVNAGCLDTDTPSLNLTCTLQLWASVLQGLLTCISPQGLQGSVTSQFGTLPGRSIFDLSLQENALSSLVFSYSGNFKFARMRSNRRQLDRIIKRQLGVRSIYDTIERPREFNTYTHMVSTERFRR